MPRLTTPLFVVAVCLVAGCVAGTGGGDNRTPPGVNSHARGEDGLIVGHRLMDAGEYELALKSYLRAAADHGINVDVLSALGSCNLRLGRLGQAEQLLRRALELDATFVPALNNLGVVLMEKGQAGEARTYFQTAYALDSGETDSIRENLKRAIAESEAKVYAEPQEQPEFSLVRRGQGRYVLLSQL